MPLLALDPRRFRKETPHKTAAHRGKTPTPKRPHMKTLLGYTQALRPEPIRLGHMTNSLFTLQTTHARRVAPDRDLLDLLQTPVVEVNGIEPMTSCLQSRRSPS